MNFPIPKLDQSFTDYIAECKSLKILEANLPYEFYPEKPIYSETNPKKLKYGAVLVHGLLDTPFILRDVGKQLQANGMRVLSILLPGHGKKPEDLLNTTLEDWQKSVDNTVEMLSREVEHVFFVGFSTGAALGIYHCFQHPHHLAGLILFSPALKIHSPLDFAISWTRFLTKIYPGALWYYKGKEIDDTRYVSVCFNALHQVYRLTKALKELNKAQSVSCPLFMALSHEDRIVEVKKAIRFFLKEQHPHSKMIIYSNKPLKFSDPRVIIRNSVYPQLRIDSFSHISIPIAPSNPHYGIKGDYSLASHLNQDNHIHYGELDKLQNLISKMFYRLGLTKTRRLRLTFNPDFEFMTEEIKEFLDTVLINKQLY